MRSFPRHLTGWSVLPACLACLALAPLLAGCGEDRSNLIPADTSETLIAKLNQVEQLAADGHCFDAKEVAASAQADIEALDEEVDPRLKRSLLDGVTQLQVFVGDPEKCTESETVETDEPVEPVEETDDPEGTTGTTGTTENGATGNQGDTDDNQDEQPQGGNGGDNPPPVTNPPDNTPNPTPTPNPTTPTGPGSGGLGPG